MAAKNSPAAPAQVRDLVITRVFDAPRELVFRAWTDPEHLKRWYSPKGCTTHFSRLDIRQGGVFHSCVRSPDGHDCWCKGVYREIVAPERIVYTVAIADERGNLVGPADVGMDADWPRETIVTVTFAEHEGRTTLTCARPSPSPLRSAPGPIRAGSRCWIIWPRNWRRPEEET